MNSTTDGNETTDNVDLTKPKVNLIDIASPNMTPEANKAVDDALDRSMEKMRATPEPNERKMVTIAVDKNLIPTVWCDPDIADLVTALNLAEIATIASCSGHGLRNGNIALEDGRELIIAENFEEARSIENAIDKAKNIRLTRAEPVENGELRPEIEHMFASAWQDGVHHLNPKYLRRDKLFTDRTMELIAQEKAKWVDEVLSKCDEKEIVLFGTECKYCGDYVDYCNCHKIRQNQRDEIRQALAKLLDKENT